MPLRSARRTPGSGRIAYLSVADDKPGLFVMDGDGNSKRRLTSGDDIFHSWSPDGCRLTFPPPDRRHLRH